VTPTAREPGLAPEPALTPESATALQRAVALLVRAASWLAMRVPNPWLQRVAHVAGAGWYLVAPRQRALARSNLRRVCEALAASGRGGPRIAAAARDRVALERLVRDAFGHRARYYVEVACVPRYSWAYLEAHLQQDAAFTQATHDVTDLLDASASGARPVFVGLHLGAVELPMYFLTQGHGLRMVSPTETIGNPALQAYLVRSRAASGVRLVPLQSARQALRAALAAGEVVGIVGDRDVSGTGVTIDLFGHAARLPVGAALLTVDSGVPMVVGAVRRSGWGEYAARMLRVEVPASGSHRARVMEAMRHQAAAIELVVADAPEQWMAVFFRIWPDLRA
jgi:lauroyl/myristoyl acyltransferase